MAQRMRFDTGLPNGHFIAKYDGNCGVCGFGFEKGEDCHYVNGKAAHGYCRSVDAGGSFGDSNGQSGQREPSWRVTGQRNHEKKCDCGLTHAGECG